MDPHHSSSGHSPHPHTHKASPTDLLSSAKVVVEAAQSALPHDAHGYDVKARVADAAIDLLSASAHYGRLEERVYGDEAMNYLHQYGHKKAHDAPTAPSAAWAADSGVAVPSSHSSDGGGDGLKKH